jgi:hypothetical protein
MAQIYHAGVQLLAGAANVPSPQHPVTDSGVHVASYPVGTQGSVFRALFPG